MLRSAHRCPSETGLSSRIKSPPRWGPWFSANSIFSPVSQHVRVGAARPLPPRPRTSARPAPGPLSHAGRRGRGGGGSAPPCARVIPHALGAEGGSLPGPEVLRDLREERFAGACPSPPPSPALLSDGAEKAGRADAQSGEHAVVQAGGGAASAPGAPAWPRWPGRSCDAAAARGRSKAEGRAPPWPWRPRRERSPRHGIRRGDRRRGPARQVQVLGLRGPCAGGAGSGWGGGWGGPSLQRCLATWGRWCLCGVF